MKAVKTVFNECKVAETVAKNNNKFVHKCLITNHVESVILKARSISKSSCHAGYMEGNYIRQLTSKGVFYF